jgi:cytochrome c556
MKYMRWAVVGSILAAGAGVAVAAAPSAIDAIKARQAGFKEIAGDFKAISDELKTGSPDWNSVRTSAHDLSTRAPGQARLFVRGSGPEAGVRTRALPAIWADAPGFARANAEFVRAAAAFDAAGQRGDLAGLVSARAALGATCKGCHEKYRASDD